MTNNALSTVDFESYEESVPKILNNLCLADRLAAQDQILIKPGHWKKSAFHQDIHRAIKDLNRYVSPDMTLVDARIGLAEYHLGGAQCDPPVNKLVAGYAPLPVDRKAAELLGMDWRNIPHLC